MKTSLIVFSVCLMILCGLGHAPSLPAQTLQRREQPNYAAQPFVVERLEHDVRFEADGAHEIRGAARVRIQSSAALETWGLLRVSYAASNGNLEFTSVTVTKPNGTVVPTPLQNVQDMPAQITVTAPFYSDIKEKQLAVRGLAVGDTLEYAHTYRVVSPMIPGQFWYAYNFFKEGIALSEELTIRVPRDRYVKVKSPNHVPVTTEEAADRVYSWKTANLRVETQETAGPGAPFAEIQLTSFRNWDEIKNWYQRLQEDRTVVTPAIRATAEEITRGAASENEKIRALYDYVATKFRYIGIAFGIGRYQPHAASEVLANGYGDCKDKHTLLAALLSAIGIRSYPALIHASARMDPEMPSPNQFDHMITAVPQENDLLWLDTTPELAPFGLLLANLRNKQALLVSGGPTTDLVTTPANPPFRTSFIYRIDGKLSENGALSANVEVTMRNDAEMLFRKAFQAAPEAQWKDIMQVISQRWGFGGTVTEVTPSSPDDLSQPFTIRYAYTRNNYSQWPDAIRLPLLSLDLAEPRKDAVSSRETIGLEPPGEYLQEARIELPASVTLRLRALEPIRKDFADYFATYAIDSTVLRAERRLVFRMHEIPSSRAQEYELFRKSVNEDSSTLFSLSSARSFTERPAPAISSEAATNRFLDLGDILYDQDDYDGAIEQYRKALELSPESVRAHRALGLARFYNDDIEGAIAEYREALRLDPADVRSHTGMGNTLFAKEDFRGAVAAYREAVRLDPNDAWARQWLGASLYQALDYDEAITTLREAVRLDPTRADAYGQLGEVLLSNRDYDAAIGAYREAVRLEPDNPARHGELADALHYGKRDFDAAIAEYRAAMRLSSDERANLRALMSIASALILQERYTETIAELHPAIERYPNDPALAFSLGIAQVRSGRTAEGMASFERALGIEPLPEALNNVAWELAQANVLLDDALTFARQAVEQISAQTTNLYLAILSQEDLGTPSSLAASWDTLGWVYFRRGEMAEAEKYIRAAWQLSQRSLISDHLGQIYEKLGNTQQAAHHYALSLAAPGTHVGAIETRRRLEALSGSTQRADQAIDAARNELSALRTVRLPRLTTDRSRAEFFVLLEPNVGVTSTKFIRGSNSLREAGAALASARYDLTFPENSSAKILRRGILDCTNTGNACEFVLLPPESVTTVN
jgi:tetratricopeptide (TPR) repeat protein